MTENKKQKIEELIKDLLLNIGENPTREGLAKTPVRVARAWEFFSQGYTANIADIVNGAIFEEECSEMVIVRDIEFFSMCEHHMIPFFGRCHVGYLPNNKIIGLSSDIKACIQLVYTPIKTILYCGF